MRKRWMRPTGNWRPALTEREVGFFLSPPFMVPLAPLPERPLPERPLAPLPDMIAVSVGGGVRAVARGCVRSRRERVADLNDRGVFPTCALGFKSRTASPTFSTCPLPQVTARPETGSGADPRNVRRALASALGRRAARASARLARDRPPRSRRDRAPTLSPRPTRAAARLGQRLLPPSRSRCHPRERSAHPPPHPPLVARRARLAASVTRHPVLRRVSPGDVRRVRPAKNIAG